ncbi:V-type K+-independent H+-translocating inorganic pyrophosphatase, putative [Plasmodium ovale]|uniref:H(+)-exporting diphosphatase n=2 Tax=Plasmodium ovale TaxID=36330 RepID=A0A1A8WAK9_PLAOA|nr:vacuolar-type H+ pumping pyrophosphatase [Plasmodium ovale curtisi]SBS98499.1 vacuolar-type H+ pumping pyrophosphatase [Plasmodium ovale curtisi]SCQ17163.1 V-type K+-independent H+-translocating inorganic pyrophosphatase, putative [Plasmodium ovale]
MLPLRGNNSNEKKKSYKNVVSLMNSHCSKQFFKGYRYGSGKRNEKGEGSAYPYEYPGDPSGEYITGYTVEYTADYAKGESDPSVANCLKYYMNRSVKYRMLVNLSVFLIFSAIMYVSYENIENAKTVCLIGLALYSTYFLLFSLYLLSTMLNDEYDTYNAVKGDVFTNRSEIHEKELNILYKEKTVTGKQIRKQDKIFNGSHEGGTTFPLLGKSMLQQRDGIQNDTEENDNLGNIQMNSYNKHKTRGEKNPEKGDSLYRGNRTCSPSMGKQPMEEYEREGAPNSKDVTCEGYEMFSFDSIGKPIREGSEGFFSVQYNSIFKVSMVFTTLIVLLYVIRGDYAKLPRHRCEQVNGVDDVNCVNDKYITISPFTYGVITAISFLSGALCSSVAAYNGIYVAVRANVKVAKAATYSYNKALVTCFRCGAVSAIVNVSLAIFGICSLLLLVNVLYPTLSFAKYPLLIVGYGFGASLVAMLYQLAGGIYTKAADIGADLVGKIEKNIPEDDARNPAVIADLVGDNVGDCAGQCADLFESISAEILASMILGGTLSENDIISEKTGSYFVLFPLFVHSMDLLFSTIGVYLVRTTTDDMLRVSGQFKGDKDKIDTMMCTDKTNVENTEFRHLHVGNNNMALYESYKEDKIKSEDLENPLKIMLKAYLFTCLLSIGGFSILCRTLFFSLDGDKNSNAWIYFSFCGLIGMTCSYLFVILTRYYTDYSFSKVKKIAQASLSGPATNIISGLYVGLESTFLPVIVISISLLLSYYLGLQSNITGDGSIINGLYGTSVATMGMLSTAVFILSMSNFGPIADNAGGIVEMSKQPKYVRVITDKLDAVGNVTKANTKGFSVGSAALACFLLFSAFLSEVSVHSKKPFTTVDIALPEVFIGGILGSVVVFLFAGWSLDAVGNTAEEVLIEVRRQFKEHPGILTYNEKPDYHTCVSIISKRALKETIKPGLLGIFSPILVGLIFKQIGIAQNNELLGAQVVASFIMFSTSTGILMALFLNNAGGAWDNAKKYIESGFYGGKNSPAHVSSVIGDTVGDPCKDTAGPSIHVLIKLISTITMVMTPLIASTSGK